LQQKSDLYAPYVEQLNKNSLYRVTNNINYQSFLKEINKKDILEGESEEFGQNDLQLNEAYNVIKDLILLMQ
jgi:carboxyl-terminal processing protease